MPRNYYVTNNAGSIHNRDTAPLLIGHSNKKTATKFFQCIGADWQILLYSLIIIISLCGESIFRKSISTIMYNYRWFILMLLNILSFLLYLLIILYRKIKKYLIIYQKKKKKLDRKQKMMQQNFENSRISINTNNDSIKSKSSVLSSTSTDLISNVSSNMSLFSDNNNIVNDADNDNDADNNDADKEKEKDAERKKKERDILRIKNKYLNWHSYIIISSLDSLHMIFIFIPIAVLPANIVMCLPLIGISIFSLFNCCISCDNHYIKLGWDNCIGSILLFISIFLLIFQDNGLSQYLKENQLNYDKKYISNLILFFIGCIILIFNDIYKRIALSKIKIDLIEFNLIQSILSIIILWLLSPLAFQIQYISKYNHENAHITNITKSMQNISNGFKCLFGINTYNKIYILDTCNHISLYYPIFHLFFLLIFIIINRLSLYQLLQKPTYLKHITNKNAFIQHLTSISIIIAFLFCYSNQIQNLWNHKIHNGTFKVYLKFDWEIPIITMLLAIGAYLSFRKIDQRKVSIKMLEDQWIIT